MKIVFITHFHHHQPHKHPPNAPTVEMGKWENAIEMGKGKGCKLTTPT
jgi:hypothetical protein